MPHSLSNTVPPVPTRQVLQGANGNAVPVGGLKKKYQDAVPMRSRRIRPLVRNVPMLQRRGAWIRGKVSKFVLILLDKNEQPIRAVRGQLLCKG